LQDFHQQISILFPGSESGTIRHFYLGPFPKDTEVMICTSKWPIPARSERDFTTFQFYHGVGDKRYKVGGVKMNFRRCSIIGITGCCPVKRISKSY
jgi:hypothetical protein